MGDMEAGGRHHLITIRRPGIVDQTMDTPERLQRSFHETLPIAGSCDVCVVESHAFRHRLDRALTAFFVDVGHDDFCSLFCK